MRALTKTGIRILSAKYRSILIKCAIINASVFISAFGSGSAMAENLPAAIQDETVPSYTLINGDETMTSDLGTLEGENRNFTIFGNGSTIDGNSHAGITVNNGQTLTINDASMQNFEDTDGGAIYNNGTIESITGATNTEGKVVAFYNNAAPEGSGGAILNDGGAEIGSITGDFIDNSALVWGGAIYNGESEITGIVGDFINNSVISVADPDSHGGAIANMNYGTNSIISGITGNFTNNHAVTSGGAIYNFSYDDSATSAINIIAKDGKDIIFSGNYVTSEYGRGGAISNDGAGSVLGLYAKEANDTITFVGGEDDTTNNKYDIDGIFNIGTLNINGFVKDSITTKYLGTVNLQNVSGNGVTNIYGGIVNANGDFTQSLLNNQAEFNFDAAGKTGTVTTLSDAETAKGTTNIKAGSFTVNGVDGATTQKAITVTSGAELTTKNNVTTTNGIANAGTLNLLGGMPPIKGPSPIRAEINSTVSGDGTTNFGNGTDNAYIKLNGAINQAMNIKEKADVETNANNIGAAVTNAGALTLTGGQLEQSVTGGNVTIAGDVTSYASIASTIGIDEGKSLTIDADNIDGAVANAGILTLDDGTLEQAITGSGTTNINDGIVIANGNFVQNELNIDNAEMKVNGVLDVSLIYLNNSAILSFGEKGGEQKINSFSELGLGNSTVNLQNNSIETLEVSRIELYGENQLLIDADLANEKMDQLNVTSVSDGGNIVVSDIKLLSDANDDYVELSLFAAGTTTDVYNKVSGNLNGLKYSTIYKYDALYDQTTGKIGFTRTEQLNPYIYAPSGVANTTAAMTTQIATLAMDKMDDAVYTQGRSGGDTPSSSNVWVRVMGLNDNVEFKNFENVDSKALTVVGGYNTDKITWADNSVVFGVYAGYIGGKQQYTANDIDQNGGYVGLSSALTLGDAFLTATVNGGLLKNKANNMYGSDRFNTLWLGTGLKAGYNYAITDSVVLQPNVYGGYTLVNTKDYTSVSGVKIATNNLNFFEVDPGLKLSAVIADGWTGSVQGKYAIVMDNGADITANDIALQNISPKNYFEYGIGIDKSVTDAFYLDAKINRHDGGRTGWSGSIEFRYKF